MSSDRNRESTLARLFCLIATLGKLVIDGKRDAGKVADILQKIVDEKSNPYLRKIAHGMLPATDGKQTMVEARGMFSGDFDRDYVNWGTNVPGKATPEIPFEVYKLVEDGKFAQIFGAFDRPLDELCWEQDKILAFTKAHPELLHPQGCGTFFLFKVKFDENTENEREEFFVASVRRLDDGQLETDAYRLSDACVWCAVSRCRFVLPQPVA